jgi:DNA-binding MarR family transcriptional regulator/ribosomal protein S18 acetylase RimI-like enzyme
MDKTALPVPGAAEIDRVRAFNRFWTREMRLIGRSYLDSGHPLSEVRVLYELANHPDQTARGLAQGLGLDEGYLSRMLKRFGAEGMIARTPDPHDSRRSRLALTEKGAAAFAPLDAASRREVGEILAPLAPAARTRLAAALDAAEAAFAPLAPETVTLRDLGPGDAGWVIGQHGALYARDEGYDGRFEALVAEILGGFLKDRDPACERGWIAEAARRRLGCIFCVRENPETARLRLFLALPEARGLGLGRRLLAACTDFARARGYRRMVLWTHESHRAACALYAKSGWRMVGSEPAEAFGQKVVDQHWVRDL